MVKSSLFHLECLSKVKPFLSRLDLKLVIHTFITSLLDDYSSLLTGISRVPLLHLQLVLNAAVRFLTGTRKQEHINPLLASINCLPSYFKAFKFVFKSLNGLVSAYLTNP